MTMTIATAEADGTERCKRSRAAQSTARAAQRSSAAMEQFRSLSSSGSNWTELSWTELRTVRTAQNWVSVSALAIVFAFLRAPRFSCGCDYGYDYDYDYETTAALGPNTRSRSFFIWFFLLPLFRFWSTSFVCFNFSAQALQFVEQRRTIVAICVWNSIEFALFLIIDTAAQAAVTHTHNNNKKEEGNKKLTSRKHT